MQNGYLDAEVSKPLMRVDFESYHATINYKIKEGVQYRVGKISFAQNLGLDIQRLQKDIKLKEGKVFDVRLMRLDMEKMKPEILA